MTRPYSEDLRERALLRYDVGETTRSIAAALRISPSCVSKWLKLRRETGSLTPGQIGGHKKRALSGETADWLRMRCRTGPFTTRGLTVFLTSHVLEIVERLCTDIAIIAHGKLLASGSLNELRKGISLEGDGQGPVSLEEYFIHVVGGTRSAGEEEVLQ